MRVANRELCQELVKLSGWTDTFLVHIEGSNDFDDGLLVQTVYSKFVPVLDNKVGCDECEGVYYPGKTIPAYDLGYLLRKLPEEYFLYKRDDWCVGSYRRNDWIHADSPENAVCQMLVALLKSDGFRKVEMV